MKFKIKNFSIKKCPDELYGTISVNSTIQWNTSCNRKLKESCNAQTLINLQSIPHNPDKNIIVVLESPHTEEYDEFGNPICPLNGSGKRFHNHFCKKIKSIKFTNNGKYNVYLVNAVQYQCSLGIRPINRYIKETIFQKIWSEGGEKDFIDRVENLAASFVSKTDLIVINACTKGKSVPMKQLVENAINTLSFFNLNNYFEMPHPASWY